MYCIYCGQKNDENYNYCINCGELNPKKVDEPEDDYQFQGESRSNNFQSVDGNFERIAFIFLEVIGWLFSILGFFITPADAYLAIGLIAGYILYKESGLKRFKIMMIIAAILLIIITLVSFTGSLIGTSYYAY